ncbi:MAG: VOC family protein [Candidatus Babeliales bacterium]
MCGNHGGSSLITRIRTQAIYVTDQAKAERFWVDCLGFDVREKDDMGNGYYWLEVMPKGAETALSLFPRALMKDWEVKKPSIVFECEDVDDAYREMTNKGVKFIQKPTTECWGTYAIFQDEDGNQFILKS